MNENVPFRVLRAQDRLREAIRVLQGQVNDPGLTAADIRVVRKMLEVQEQLLTGVE